MRWLSWRSRRHEARWRARLQRKGVEVGEGARLPMGSRLVDGARIGAHTRFRGPVVMRGQGDVVIGNFCAIGEELRILSSNHDLRLANVQIDLQRRLGSSALVERRGPVTIGSNAWIGDRVTVLPGVEIGVGAAIGAASVVSRDVAPFAVVAGTPARFIRPRFSEPVVELLLELSWWDWPLDRVLRNRRFFELDLTETDPDEIRRSIVE